MPGAELFGLQHRLDAVRRDGSLDLRAPRPRHDDDPRGVERAERVDQVQQHRAAGDRVEDLVQVRLHPRALAGSEDDHG